MPLLGPTWQLCVMLGLFCCLRACTTMHTYSLDIHLENKQSFLLFLPMSSCVLSFSLSCCYPGLPCTRMLVLHKMQNEPWHALERRARILKNKGFSRLSDSPLPRCSACCPPKPLNAPQVLVWAVSLELPRPLEGNGPGKITPPESRYVPCFWHTATRSEDGIKCHRYVGMELPVMVWARGTWCFHAVPACARPKERDREVVHPFLSVVPGSFAFPNV